MRAILAIWRQTSTSSGSSQFACEFRAETCVHLDREGLFGEFPCHAIWKEHCAPIAPRMMNLRSVLSEADGMAHGFLRP